MSCSAIKTRVEEEVGRGCVFQGGCCSEIHWASVFSWEMVSDCPCKTLVFFFPSSLIKHYLDPWVLSLLLFLFSPLSCCGVGGSEWVSGWMGLSGWLGSTHHRAIYSAWCILLEDIWEFIEHIIHLKSCRKSREAELLYSIPLTYLFISVSPYLRFDRCSAILSAMSSDLCLCFSHGFLSSLELWTQVKAGRTFMLSLKRRLAFFAGLKTYIVATEPFLLCSVEREEKTLPLPHGYAFLHVLYFAYLGYTEKY